MNHEQLKDYLRYLTGEEGECLDYQSIISALCELVEEDIKKQRAPADADYKELLQRLNSACVFAEEHGI